MSRFDTSISNRRKRDDRSLLGEDAAMLAENTWQPPVEVVQGDIVYMDADNLLFYDHNPYNHQYMDEEFLNTYESILLTGKVKNPLNVSQPRDENGVLLCPEDKYVVYAGNRRLFSVIDANKSRESQGLPRIQIPVIKIEYTNPVDMLVYCRKENNEHRVPHLTDNVLWIKELFLLCKENKRPNEHTRDLVRARAGMSEDQVKKLYQYSFLPPYFLRLLEDKVISEGQARRLGSICISVANGTTLNSRKYTQQDVDAIIGACDVVGFSYEELALLSADREDVQVLDDSETPVLNDGIPLFRPMTDTELADATKKMKSDYIQRKGKLFDGRLKEALDKLLNEEVGSQKKIASVKPPYEVLRPIIKAIKSSPDSAPLPKSKKQADAALKEWQLVSDYYSKYFTRVECEFSSDES